MAAGKIIIAHDFKTITEVLIHNYNALIADHQSFDDLLNKVNQALSLKNNQLGINARQEAFHKYTWEMRAQSIINNLSQS